MSGKARVEDEWSDGIHELGLQQLDRRHFGEEQAPRIAIAQVHLLEILVELALRKEVRGIGQILGQQPRLRKLRRMGQASRRRGIALRECWLSTGEKIVAAQALVSSEESLRVFRQLIRRGFFSLKHMPVEIGRTPHRLTGVIDDEIQAVASGQQVPAKSLHTRGVSQIETEDFEAVSPVGLKSAS